MPKKSENKTKTINSSQKNNLCVSNTQCIQEINEQYINYTYGRNVNNAKNTK